jgi:hypothetical protein
MSEATAPSSPSPVGTDLAKDPAHSAYILLRLGFVALPLLMGLDKFTNLLTDWPNYLAPWLADVLPFSAQTAMYIVGVVEIIAAIAMVVRPRWAAWVVALWLAGIIINLLTYSGFYDVALRDFGLLIAAVTLGLLAQKYNRPRGKAVNA